jgi:hypothetical protein
VPDRLENDDQNLPKVPWLTREEILARDIAEVRAAGFWVPIEVLMDDGVVMPGKAQIRRSTGDPGADFDLAAAKTKRALWRIVDHIVEIRPALPPGVKRQTAWEKEGISRATWFRRQKATK